MDTNQKKEVVIVGGSLAGLMHGIVLSRLGHNVTILEKSPSESRGQQGGAGLGTGSEGQRFVTTYDPDDRPYSFHCPGFCFVGEDGSGLERTTFALNLTSWTVYYYRLRWLFDGLVSPGNQEPRKRARDEGKAIIQLGSYVQEVQPADKSSSGKMRISYLDYATGHTQHVLADLVLDASGFGSQVRKSLLEEVPVSYEGILGLRGTVPETLVLDTTRALFDERNDFYFVTSLQNGHWAVAYMVPSDNGSLEKGERLINYVWYKPVIEGSEVWKKTMTGTDGVLHRNTLLMGTMTDEARDAHVRESKTMLDPVFQDLVAHTKKPFLTAIRESIPDRISFHDGRLLLVGESACLATPWAGVAVNQSAISAFSLEKAMKGEISIEDWEPRTLASARKLAAMCKAVGHGFLKSKDFRIDSKLENDANGIEKGPWMRIAHDGTWDQSVDAHEREGISLH